jgi:hypothetical protein
MAKEPFYITLESKDSGNRRTERVTTCDTFAEAETKLTHDGRFHFDPQFEEIICIVKGDRLVRV